MATEVYKIKLIGHDLFYQPVKGRWSDTKTNLGSNGKIYTSEPSVRPLNDPSSYVRVSESIASKHSLKCQAGYDGLILDDCYGFELITYRLVEVDRADTGGYS